MASTSSPDRPRNPDTALPAGQVREKALPLALPTLVPAVGFPTQPPAEVTETQSGATERSLVSAYPLSPASTRPEGQAVVKLVPSVLVPNAGIQSVLTRALERDAI